MDLVHRPRRLRQTPALRRLTRETRLHPAELIAPLFVEAGRGIHTPLASMPGQFRFSVDTVVEEGKRLERLGVGGVILFGIPARKDLHATTRGATDVDNDATLPLLAQEAVCYARAGADVVAPSAMMDGQVAAIRAGLDAAGFRDTPILAYSAKSASAFYGPFRDAAGSTPGKGDRKGYQMDPANRDEALREVRRDVAQGADAVMVKPAGPNLDLIRDAANEVDVPVAAYQVSGEYSCLHAAAERGWLDLDRAAYESLIGIRRAGALWILTYFAEYAAQAMHTGRWDRV
jgi:porphobilinogen synthase